MTFGVAIAVIANKGPLTYSRLRPRVPLSLGVFGALLVVLLIPGGIALGRLFDSFSIQWRSAPPMLPVGTALYYLAWKYLVSLLNEEIGIT